MTECKLNRIVNEIHSYCFKYFPKKLNLSETANYFANYYANDYDEYMIIYQVLMVNAESIAKEYLERNKAIAQQLYETLYFEQMESVEVAEIIAEMQEIAHHIQELEMMNIFPYKSRITKEWQSCFNDNKYI